MTTVTIDEAKLGAFVEHVLGDAAALMSTTLAELGRQAGFSSIEQDLPDPLNALYVVKP